MNTQFPCQIFKHGIGLCIYGLSEGGFGNFMCSFRTGLGGAELPLLCEPIRKLSGNGHQIILLPPFFCHPFQQRPIHAF